MMRRQWLPMWMGIAGLVLGVVLTLAYGDQYLHRVSPSQQAAETAIGQLEAQCLVRAVEANTPAPGKTLGDNCREQAKQALAALR